MKNLESFESFAVDQIENHDAICGGTLYPTYQSVEDKITDFYDTATMRWVYLQQ